MHRQAKLAVTVLWLALGCGGTVQGTPGGGDSSVPMSGDAPSGVNVSSSSSGGPGGTSGGSSGGSSSGSSSMGTTEGSSSSGSSGGDGGASVTFDAEVPDAFPGSCGQFTFALDPDAAPYTCAFTPTDVACNASTDCDSYLVNGCGCIEPVYGVNTASTAKCEPPPCPPPPNGCPADASGFETQDCKLVQGYSQVAVACVNHRCMTYAAGAK